MDGGLELQRVHRAADGTHKLVFRLTVNYGSLADQTACIA